MNTVRMKRAAAFAAGTAIMGGVMVTGVAPAGAATVTTIPVGKAIPKYIPAGTTVQLRAGTYALPQGLVLRGSLVGQPGTRLIATKPGNRLSPGYPAPRLGEGLSWSHLPRGAKSAQPVQAWGRDGVRIPHAKFSVGADGVVRADRPVARVSRTFGWGVLMDDNSTLKNVTIEGHSPSLGEATIGTLVGANNVKVQNVTIKDSGGVAIKIQGGARDITTNVRLDNVKIVNPGWSGLVANYATNVYVNGGGVYDANRDKDFAIAPQSGAIKASKVHNLQVSNWKAERTQGHGIWLDQSVYGASVQNSDIQATGSAMFCEISYGLKMSNTTLRSYGPRLPEGRSALRIASCQKFQQTGTKFVVSGRPQVEKYLDKRGRKMPNGVWCANHPQRYGKSTSFARDCPPGMASDLDRSSRPTPGMTWTN